MIEQGAEYVAARKALEAANAGLYLRARRAIKAGVNLSVITEWRNALECLNCRNYDIPRYERLLKELQASYESTPETNFEERQRLEENMSVASAVLEKMVAHRNEITSSGKIEAGEEALAAVEI